MIIKIWLVVFLIVCSITDIYERKVYTMFCIANGVAIGLIHFFIKDITFGSVVMGILLGVGFLMISLIYKDSIGLGDGIVLCVIGMAVGFIETMEVLIWASLISTVVAISGICTRKLNLKSTLPFIPFLFLGTVITVVIREG